MIDELTECLEDSITGEVFRTEYEKIEMTPRLSKKLLNQGWRFNWDLVDDKNTIIKLHLKNSLAIEGLVAFHEDDDFLKIDLVESAPYNVGTGNGLNGVGGHLFAIACKASFGCGSDGYVLFIPKTKLKNYYVNKLGAKYTPSGNMFLDSNASSLLISKYMNTGE
ncbi:hypothetical protein [Companilactobacillus hulinensis]|uniref:hypothetical protein n=1 Tax=Companilactobacillus hulinensis TaxID=2486007 RepID=UPI000F76E59A|nr:hypothetical protein [Companilactobacillus hulinensis]